MDLDGPAAAPTFVPGMTDHLLTRTIEECCLNAWPGLQQQVLDGWLLRFGAGYTRRANSVHAVYAGQQPVAERVALCEAAYAARGQRCVFKITPLAQPAELDAWLEQAGYGREGETSVQVLEPLPPGRPDPACTLVDPLGDAWLDTFARLDGAAAPQRMALRGILGNIVPRHTAALLREEGAVRCCGRAVLEHRHVGLFDIATDAAHRGRGLAPRLIAHLLAWGARSGATRAYLQVEADNTAALRLYERLGFRELYRYWYRAR